MKCVKTVDAVGHVLCHDITQIIKDVSKDARFRKGHVVTPEDIPVLLACGKENLYVWEKNDDMYHEDEAAAILRDLCMNQYMKDSEPKEGKIELTATQDGLFLADNERLAQVNGFGEMMIASRSAGTMVKAGDKLCGTRIIPLVIEKEKMKKVCDLVGEKPLFTLYPLKKKKVGIVTIGNEVYSGRITDTFGPVVASKVSEFGAEVLGQVILPDDHEQVTKAILEWVEKGADMVLCTGGMSVDPDDKTPLAIRNTGAEIVSYGAPVLPGAMFLLSYYHRDGKSIPICGLPGCVMYAKRTIFDLVLPFLMTDVCVTPKDLSKLGNGGLCLNCDVCHFPNCGFGSTIGR